MLASTKYTAPPPSKRKSPDKAATVRITNPKNIPSPLKRLGRRGIERIPFRGLSTWIYPPLLAHRHFHQSLPVEHPRKCSSDTYTRGAGPPLRFWQRWGLMQPAS